MPRINHALVIDDDEIRFEFARSSGPGGQNVNKVETKVRLLFDVADSPSLNAAQRARIEDKLSTRITKVGVLYISSQRHRTREANRKATIEKFVELLAGALAVEKPRKKTRISKTQKAKRLESKKRKSRKKAMRSRPDEDY